MTPTLGYLGDLCASLVGVVLLVSAFAKVREPRRFAQDVSNYKVLPARLNRAVTWLIIAAEPAIGLSLLLAIEPSISLPAALALLASFTAAVGINLLRSRRIVCGCFGNDELIGRSTLLRLAMLIGLVLMALAVRIVIAQPTTELDLGTTIARTSTAALILTALFWTSRWADLRLLTSRHSAQLEAVS
jgi:hypothetical protein